MMLIVQFPLVDIRKLSANEKISLNMPFWPIPEKNEFIRSFGGISERRRLGVKGWIGENAFCSANKAIKFSKKITYKVPDFNKSITGKIVFKRFFFDGLAVGKFEIGLSITVTSAAYSKIDMIDLIENLIRARVSIKKPKASPITCELINAGKHLCQLYAASSTPHNTVSSGISQLVQIGEPILFVELKSNTSPTNISRTEFDIPKNKNKIINLKYLLANRDSIAPRIKAKCIYAKLSDGSKMISVISDPNDFNERKAVRIFRICLLRLQAERECLKKVLAAIGKNKISIERGTVSSDLLQRYLNDSIRHISRQESTLSDIDDNEFLDWVRSIEDDLLLSERSQLLSSLHKVESILSTNGIRLNILRKVTDYTNQIINQYTIMGDQYNNSGNAGSMGYGSQGTVNIYNQSWQQIAGSTNLNTLAQELGELRYNLKKRAITLDEDKATVSVGEAEDEAKKGNGPKVLEYLAKGGKWVLSVAEEIGVKVATETIKEALKSSL